MNRTISIIGIGAVLATLLIGIAGANSPQGGTYGVCHGSVLAPTLEGVAVSSQATIGAFPSTLAPSGLGGGIGYTGQWNAQVECGNPGGATFP